ncbi:MAG: VirB4 family type IV secretion system protein, partial [Stackebrandtia sp.]
MNAIKKILSTVLPGRTAANDRTVECPQWWPDAVRVRPRSITCGAGEAAVLVVVGYPGELGPAWLEPLLAWPGRLDVAMHAEPVAGEVALMRLRKRRARLESARRGAASDGRLDDPQVEAAADDAADLSARIARGQSRLFRLALYLTVHAPDPSGLEAAISQVRSITSSLLLDARSATFRQLPGLITTLPLACDLLGAARTVDTDTIAASFPFASPDPPLPENGVLYGVNLLTGSPLIHDRWAQDNHNAIVVARSGAGKSFFAKTELLRHVYDETQCTVIDPDGEYVDLAHHVGGSVIEVGKPGVHLNPLDIPAHAGDDCVDALTRRVMFVGTYAATCLRRDLDAGEQAALDTSVLAAYAEAGITADPKTWTRTPPTLVDVDTHLAADTEHGGAQLSSMLRPYIHGGFSHLTHQHTTTSLNG